MNKIQIALVSIVCTIITIAFGCVPLLEELTPTTITDRCLKFANVSRESLGPIASLADARRVKIELIINHRDKQLQLKRLSEDDNLANNDALGFINASIASGENTLALAIGSEDNPFSILGMLVTLGIGGSGLALGKNYLKRPGDYTPQEHEAEIIMAKNGNA